MSEASVIVRVEYDRQLAAVASVTVVVESKSAVPMTSADAPLFLHHDHVTLHPKHPPPKASTTCLRMPYAHCFEYNSCAVFSRVAGP